MAKPWGTVVVGLTADEKLVLLSEVEHKDEHSFSCVNFIEENTEHEITEEYLSIKYLHFNTWNQDNTKCVKFELHCNPLISSVTHETCEEHKQKYLSKTLVKFCVTFA